MTTAVKFPETFATDFEALCPDNGLGEAADAALIGLAEHGFVAALGVQQRQLGALAVMAGQDHIREYCPNDEKRFVGAPRVGNWLKKGRQMIGIYSREDQWKFELDELPALSGNELWQVAYAWFGPEANNHIPNADITTAYRVGESGQRMSRERRHSETDKFKLGLPLGILVSAVAINKFDISPNRISLETWQSNNANALYDQLGFVQPKGVEPIRDDRPTLANVGSDINGHKVYMDVEHNMHKVKDYRLHKVLP